MSQRSGVGRAAMAGVQTILFAVVLWASLMALGLAVGGGIGQVEAFAMVVIFAVGVAYIWFRALRR